MADNGPALSRLRSVLPSQNWFSDLHERLLIQWRVIYAVIMREARTRYGKSDLGYLWAIIDPLVEISIMVMLFSYLGRTPPIAAPLPVFLAMGLLPFGFMRRCIVGGASVVGANKELLTYPQVKVFDLVIGRITLEFCTTAVVYMLFMVGLDVFFDIPFTFWYDEPLGMSLAVMSLFFVGASLALASSSMTRLFPVWPSIFSYLSRPLWFLSAIFYTLESLPHGPRQFIIYNPLAHVVEWFRSASSPVMDSHAYSLSFVFQTAVILIVLGIVIDRTLTAIGYSDRTS